MHAYQRNNKSKGQKNLRCFPSCCVGFGHQEGFCGQSVTITLTLPKEHPAALDPSCLVGIAEFAVEGSPVRALNELLALSNPKKNMRKVLDGTGSYLEGCRLPWRESDRVQNGEDGVHRVEFEFNKHLKGWHYGFLGSKKTREYYHVFRAYVLQKDANSGKHRVLAFVTSPPWQMYCRRRKHTTHRIHQPIQNPVEFAKTPSSDRCAVSLAAKKLKTKRKSVDEVEAELATEEEQNACDGNKKCKKDVAEEYPQSPELSPVLHDPIMESPAFPKLSRTPDGKGSSTSHLLVQLLGKMQLPNPFLPTKQEARICLKPTSRGRDVVDLGYDLLLALQQFSSPPVPKFWNVNKDNATLFMKLRTRKCLAAFLLEKEDFRYQFLEVFTNYQMKDDLMVAKMCQLVESFLPQFINVLKRMSQVESEAESQITAKCETNFAPQTPKGHKDDVRCFQRHQWFSPAHSLKSINTEAAFSPALYVDEDAKFLKEALEATMLSPVNKDKENHFKAVNQKQGIDLDRTTLMHYDSAPGKITDTSDFGLIDCVDGYSSDKATSSSHGGLKSCRFPSPRQVESSSSFLSTTPTNVNSKTFVLDDYV